MSIALPITGLAALLASFFVYQILRRALRRSPNFAGIATLLMLPLLFLALLPIINAAGTSEGFDVSSAEAQRRGLHLRLPDAASNVDFHQYFHQRCFVDFSIDEVGFLEWCHARGWQPAQITSEIWTVPLRDGNDGITIVAEGYEAITHPHEDDFAGTVVYDKRRQRAHYRFHSY